IAYISDRSGEDELYIAPQDGLGKEQQITSGHKGFMFQPVWSYDSKKLAWADQTLRLWYVEVTEKKPMEVDRAKYGEITNYSWSPDSIWLAYDKPAESLYSFVNLYSLADRKITPVTTTMYNSFAPTFDPDGIQDRIVALPGEPAVIRSFSAAKGFIYFATAPAQGLSGPIPGEASAVHAYDLKERKNKVLIEEVERFALSFDGTKLLYESGPPGGAAGAEGVAAHSYGIIDAKPDEKPK